MDIFINKKARFKYEIVETYQAGIVLVGTEIKSIREKRGNIVDAYATFKKGELFVQNFRIEPYLAASHFNHDPERTKKLLLQKKEIRKIYSKLKIKGTVLVPLKAYMKSNRLKVSLGLGRGKKLHDKKNAIKERDIQKDMDREMKNYQKNNTSNLLLNNFL